VELLPLLVALVGLGFAIARALHVSRFAVDPGVFGTALEKCLRTGHVERGLKLCAAVGDAPVATATAAMLQKRALPPGTTEDDARTTLRDAFITAFEAKAAPLAAYRFAAWLALLLLVVPVAHGFATAALAPRLVVVALVGLAVLAWTARSVSQTLGGGPPVLERLLPHAIGLVLGTATTYRSVAVAPEPAIDPTALVFAVARDGVREGTRAFTQPIVKIGRADNAHLRLDDEAVGRMHAVVERDAAGAAIVDLGNASGTTVNGERVNRAELAHGDVVGIGPFQLTVGLGARASTTEETDDPRTWSHLAALFYGFEQRSPDLFYEVVPSCVTGRTRIAKVRRHMDGPRFFVAVLAESPDELAATRQRIEREAATHYGSYATPAADIAPDAAYGAETGTHARLLSELAAGEATVLATRSLTPR